MKRASRIPSVIAALTLLLGMTVSVAAQTDTLPVSVMLDRPQDICDITFSASGSFGTWTWNAESTRYLLDTTSSPGGAKVIVSGDINSMPALGCNISVAFAGLSNGSGGLIQTNRFSAYSWWRHSQQNGVGNIAVAGWNHTRVTGVPVEDVRTYDFEYTLNTVPNTLPVGQYTGNINITYSNAQ